jgi:hypothetical protein
MKLKSCKVGLESTINLKSGRTAGKPAQQIKD